MYVCMFTDDTVECNLIAEKGCVAPLKSQSISRLSFSCCAVNSNTGRRNGHKDREDNFLE